VCDVVDTELANGANLAHAAMEVVKQFKNSKKH
jgi:hypothetical protein